MKKYFADRNGLLNDKLNIDLDDLKKYFLDIYRFFSNKEYFKVATEGVWVYQRYSNDPELIVSPLLAPSPQVFFANCLQSNEIWPIWEYCEYYSEEVLFTVIEVLHDVIAIYDHEASVLNKIDPQKEFDEQINAVLKMYRDGYYLEPATGFIMNMPNESLKQQLAYAGDAVPEEVYTKLSTATKMYYRFDSDMEMKKKAINVLADILEIERDALKDILNNEYEVSKNEHDKLIFGIVNGFSIRHNRADQNEKYSKEIWYDWMMQYYTSVIIAYYKLVKKHTS